MTVFGSLNLNGPFGQAHPGASFSENSCLGSFWFAAWLALFGLVNGRKLRKMPGDLGQNLSHRFFVGNIVACRRPFPAGVQSIPGGAAVCASFGRVPVFAKTVTDSHFVVPNRFEHRDQIILGGFLPRALHDQEATIEVCQLDVGYGPDAPLVVQKASG